MIKVTSENSEAGGEYCWQNKISMFPLNNSAEEVANSGPNWGQPWTNELLFSM